jgi:cation transport ATPase
MGLFSDSRAQMEAARLEATPKLKALLETADSPEPKMIAFIGYFSRMVIPYVIVSIGLVVIWILVRRGWHSSLAWLLVWWHAILVIIAAVLVSLGALG